MVDSISKEVKEEIVMIAEEEEEENALDYGNGGDGEKWCSIDPNFLNQLIVHSLDYSI